MEYFTKKIENQLSLNNVNSEDLDSTIFGDDFEIPDLFYDVPDVKVDDSLGFVRLLYLFFSCYDSVFICYDIFSLFKDPDFGVYGHF